MAVELVMVVVVFLARLPVPTCVPAPPEHLVDTQATAHWYTLKVGPPVGLETVTE